MRTQVKTGNLLEARETRVTKIGLVLVLYLIGWDGGTSLSGPITEQSKEKPKQSRVMFDTQLKTAFIELWNFSNLCWRIFRVQNINICFTVFPSVHPSVFPKNV